MAHLHMQGASTVDLIKTANMYMPSLPCFIELYCGLCLACFGTGHTYMLNQLHSLAG